MIDALYTDLDFDIIYLPLQAYEIRKNTGLALRFPKFTGKIRMEKTAEDASTDEEVVSLYKAQNKSAHDKNLM